MKRILPLLLAALLLLTACGTASTADQDPALPPETEPGAPSSPAEGPDEDELPIMLDNGEFAPPVLSDTQVTLDGLGSYLRLTLPEGWAWEQTGGSAEKSAYILYPENDPDFKVELHIWPDGFGMCGTGVTTQDYVLPDGSKATLAYEQIGEDFSWTLILPESPDSFTIQFAAPSALYEAHREELELMLGTIQMGVLAQADAVEPETATG